MTPIETAFQAEFCMVFDHQGAIATRIATSRTRFLFRTHRGHQAGGCTCDRQSARFPIALAHGHRANSLFDRVIHRSGDSTCSDNALGVPNAFDPFDKSNIHRLRGRASVRAFRCGS
jgi:hypothetical protein